MLDNLESVGGDVHVEPFTFKYRWIDSNMLIMVCTRELIYVGKAQPIYNQVTLERSDFRTDFRTRLMNKQSSVNGSAKLILPCQGITNQNDQYDTRVKRGICNWDRSQGQFAYSGKAYGNQEPLHCWA